MNNVPTSIFSILSDESDAFPLLVKKYGIDPAKDLRHCDPTNVDFGELETPILDLTGCILTGADWS